MAFITYKSMDIIFFTPFSIYRVFWIDKPLGLSNANALSFIIGRIIILVQDLLLPMPVFLLIVKVVEWSGDYLTLVFFLATAFVEMIILWLYPRLIKPLTAKMTPLADECPEN